MAALSLILRLATPADIGGVDDLLARSYGRLLAADYPPSVMVTAVPRLARAQPGLLASGRYWVVVDDASGRILGAGGWSAGAGGSGADPAGGCIHVRHLATDPDHLRRGIAAAIMDRVVRAAEARGVPRIECLATRTAVPFYARLGFVRRGATSVQVAAGIDFAVVRMARMTVLPRRGA